MYTKASLASSPSGMLPFCSEGSLQARSKSNPRMQFYYRHREEEEEMMGWELQWRGHTTYQCGGGLSVSRYWYHISDIWVFEHLGELTAIALHLCYSMDSLLELLAMVAAGHEGVGHFEVLIGSGQPCIFGGPLYCMQAGLCLSFFLVWGESNDWTGLGECVIDIFRLLAYFLWACRSPMFQGTCL